jgi:hypothetical protein
MAVGPDSKGMDNAGLGRAERIPDDRDGRYETGF